MSEGALFSVRYWLGFQENQLIFGPGQAQLHRECVGSQGELFDFPVSVEFSNSNRHFVWSWLKRFPWLAYSKYLDGTFCLPCKLRENKSNFFPALYPSIKIKIVNETQIEIQRSMSTLKEFVQNSECSLIKAHQICITRQI